MGKDRITGSRRASGDASFGGTSDDASSDGSSSGDSGAASSSLIYDASTGFSGPMLLGGGAPPAPPMLPARLGDIDGDGKSDILWFYTNASNAADPMNNRAYVWRMNGTAVLEAAPTSDGAVSPNWRVAGAGDFDGDGRSDYLWRYRNAGNASDPLNGVAYLWEMNGTTVRAEAPLAVQPGINWSIAGTGDFSGDNVSDILFRYANAGNPADPLNGQTMIWTMNGFAPVTQALTSVQVQDPNWQIAGTGDFDGDGKADILWRYQNTANAADPLNGATYVWLMNGATVVTQGLTGAQPGSANWSVVGVGNVGADTKADILFRYENGANGSDPLNGALYLFEQNGLATLNAAPLSQQVGDAWAVVGFADYDGDGKADVLFRNVSDPNAPVGATYEWSLSGTSVIAQGFTAVQSYDQNWQALDLAAGEAGAGTVHAIAEGAAAGTVVGNFSASGDSSGPVVYSLAGDTSGGGFAIDATTGIVVVADASKIDYETSGADHNYTLAVLATAGSSATTRTFVIGVTDVAPSVPMDGDTAPNSVAEGATAGTTVGVTASSVDPNGPAVSYSITSDSSGGGFKIDASTGIVTVANGAKLDYETAPNHAYTINVQASDGTLTAAQSFVIAVTDVNDNAPVITSGATGTEAENTAAANVVYTAQATDADGSAPNNTVTYSLGGTDAALFNIDATSGAVTFKTSPDFENPGDADHNNAYQINVVATDGGTPALSATKAVTITVTDVNEAPVITSGSTGGEAENTLASNIVYAAQATDPDGTAPNNTVTYSLGGTDAALFSINSTGAVTFKTSPDFENPGDADHNNAYQINVTATDGGTPALSATKAVTITVTDVNDNTPVITSGAAGTEAENTTAANVVYTAQATDADGSAPNNSVTYSLGGADAALFNIDSSTGAITFKASPDFENPGDADHNNAYQINVVATDGGTPALSATKAVTITVTDVNEAPTITSGSTGGEAENTLASNIVYATQATDPDGTAPNNTLTYSLGGTDAGLFNISSTGAVTFKTSPDFENPGDADHNNAYQINVTATDGGTPALSATKAVTITVTDVNDNTPVITSGATGTEAENTAANNVVYTAQATDADGSAPNNSVTYSLGGTDAALFNIDATSGAVTFKTSPDFENPGDADHNNAYQIDVTATDGGTPALSATKAVTITVTDVNDNTPVISSGASATTPENVATTTAVYTAQATDADGSAPNNSVTYALGGTDAGAFNIDSSTGAITFKASPDFENPGDADHNNAYQINVTATDGGTPALSATKAVTIAVTDVNDNTPVITSGATGTEFENTAASNIVYQAQATDADGSAPNNTITYSLTGTDSGLFNIDASTGAITFKASPDFENPGDADHNNAYQINVVATDGGTPALSSSKAVTITVTNLNEAPVGADKTISGQGAHVFVAGDFGFSDPLDNPPNMLAAVEITTLPATGALTDNASPVTAGQFVTKSDIDSGLLVFTPDNSGATATFTFQVRDDGGTANGGQDTDQSPNTITLVPNTPPTANADAITATEAGGTSNGTPGHDPQGNVVTGIGTNGPGAMNSNGEVADSDVEDPPSSLVVVKAGTGGSPSGGDALVSSTGTAIIGSHGALTIHADGSYSYVVNQGDSAVNALNPSQTLPDTFHYTIQDTGGLQSSAAINVTIHGANDAPVANADTRDYYAPNTPGGASAALNPDVVVNDTDPDNGDTITVVGLKAGTDSTPQSNVPANGSVTVVGQYGSLQIYNADGYAPYTIDTTNSAVLALRTPDQTLTDTFTYTIKDSGGLTSTAQISIIVHGGNDAPVANPDTGNATEQGGTANNTGGSNATGNVLTNDTDPDNPAGFTANPTPANGETQAVKGVEAGNHTSDIVTTGVASSITGAYGAVTIQTNGSYIYVVDNSNPTVQALNVGGTLADTFTYTMTDAAGATSTSTLTVTINGADDAPAVTAGGTLSYLENQAATAIDNTIAVSDVDNTTLASATIQITGNYVNGEDVLGFTAQNGITAGAFNTATGTLTLMGSSSVANYQTALRSVTYRDTSDNPSGADRTISYSVNDGTVASTAATSTIHVTPVNDAPVVTTGTLTGFTEPPNGTPASSATPVTVAPNLIVSDVDSANLSSASVVLTNLKPSDALSVSGHAGSSGTIGAIGFTITSTATTETVAFTGADTLADYQAALRLVQFVNTSENPDTTSRSYTVTAVDDGGTANGGNNTGSATASGTVTAVNDPPTATVPANASVFTAFSHTDVPISGLSVADVDAGSGNVTATIASGHGALTFTTTGLSSSTNNGTHTVTLTGTVAQVNTALASLVYNSDDGFTGSDTVSLSVGDNGNTGTGGPQTSSTSSFQVGVVPQVWVIDNTAGGTNVGTAANPFKSLAAYNASSAPGTGDYVYLKNGSGSYAEADGINLKAGETLVGGGQTLSFVNPVTNAVVTVFTGTGTASKIAPTGASNSGIDLTSGDTVQGISIDTSGNGGVGISDGGASVGTLSLSDIAIKSSSGTGLALTHGGTVTATGTNSITATSGTALDVESTNIGSGNLTFQSISSGSGSNSSANGIILSNTGTGASNGGLHVTGVGTTAGSGGTIQHKTGADANLATQGTGIYLNNTKDVQLADMQLNDFQNYGISGTNVTGFTLDHTTINGTNGTLQGGIGEGDVYFTGLSGSATISNSSLTGAAYDALHVFNDAGQTLNRITVTGSTFATQSGAGNATNDAIGFQATGGTFNATLQGNNVTSARSDQFQLNLLGTVSSDLVLGGATTALGNNFTNTNQNIVSGGGGITIGGGGPTNNITLTYNISHNTIKGALGAALAVTKGTGTNASFTGTIDSNIIGTQGVAGSGSSQGDGIAVFQDGAGNSNATITNNHISGTVEAIYLLNHNAASGTTGTMTGVVQGNTIDTLDQTNGFAGIYLQTGSGTGAGGDTNKSNWTIGGPGALANHVDIGSNSAGAIVAGIVLEQEGVSKVGLITPAGGSAYSSGGNNYNFTAVQNYVAGNDTFSATPNAQPVFAFGDSGKPAGGGYFAGAQFQLLAGGGVQAASPTAGETHLTQAELDDAITAAIADWAAAGATDAQLAALRGASYTIADLGSGVAGQTTGNHVELSIDAAGQGWFIDPTPSDNSEFAFVANAAGTNLFTDPSTAAAGHIDLVTVVAHEMGHVLGLPDIESPANGDDLMSQNLVDGERRLPDATDVTAALGAQRYDTAAYGAPADPLPANSTFGTDFWSQFLSGVGANAEAPASTFASLVPDATRNGTLGVDLSSALWMPGLSPT